MSNDRTGDQLFSAPERTPLFDPSATFSPPQVTDIPIEIQAVIGKVKVSVAQLMASKQGEYFRLDKHFGEPIELQVNGQTIGYGEIVADDRDNLIGIRMVAVSRR